MATVRQKRVAAAILLSSLIVSAFFFAQGTTLLAAAALLPTDQEVVGGPPGAPGLSAARRSAIKSDARIRQRNIFDAALGPLTDAPQVADGADAMTPAPDLSIVDPNNLPNCEGTLRLVASVDNTRAPDWSFAAITAGAERPLLYRVGMQVQSHQIIAINAKRVVLLPTGSSYCQIAMFDPAATPRPTPRARPTPGADDAQERRRSRRSRAEGSISQADMEAGIHKNSDDNYTLDRAFVERIIENQAELMRSARIIPHEEDGRVVGVKMYGIRRRSLLGRLGMMNGDILRTINGFDMSSPDSALEAYARLREADHLTVSIIRRGQPSTIDYNIQ